MKLYLDSQKNLKRWKKGNAPKPLNKKQNQKSVHGE